IRNAELTPDAHLAGWTNTSGELWTLSLKPRGVPKLIFRTSGAAFGPSFSRDGRLAAAGSGDRAARVWNLETGERIRKIQFGNDGFHSVAISPDGEQVTTGDWWGVEIWRISDGVRLRALTAHRGDTDQVRYSRDGTLLVSTGVDRCLRVWETSAASG